MTDARTPNPLLAALGRALEAVLNRAVALDADTRTRLAALDGRAVSLTVAGTPLALRVQVEQGALRVGPAFAGDSALRVSATPGSLLSLALRRGGGESAIPPGKVEIAGDAELARRLEKLASGYRPDIEEAFTRVFGDVAGVALARALGTALQGLRERGQRLVEDTAEYLVEESRDLVAPDEMHAFLDDVDALRERAERLEARLRRLADTAARAGARA